MFKKFYDFVGIENKNNVTDMSGFMDIYGGETFLNGCLLYTSPSPRDS